MAGAVKSITCANGWVTAASGGTINTADVTNDAITFAKMQNVSSGVLLGRSTSGAGDIETISVGSGLSLSAGTLSSTLTYGDEQAQDAVGGILTDSSTIDFTYTDATPSITAAVITQMSLTSDGSGVKLSGDSGSPGNNKVYGTNGSGTKGWYDSGAYSDEQAQDAVGNILGNTDTISFAYADATPSITAAVNLSPYGSIESTVNGIRLDGDTATPGNDYFYGTNSSGDKGWYPRYVTAPTSPGDSGVNGQVAYDDVYWYWYSSGWHRIAADAWA